MRKLSTLVVMVAFLSAPVFAHEEAKQSDRWLKVSTDAMVIMFGSYRLHGEFKWNEQMSIFAYASYIDTRVTINSNVNRMPGVFGEAGLGARWYLKPACMSGLYVEDYVAFDYGRTFSGNDEPNSVFGPVNANIFALGNALNAGYSWVTDIGFFVDLYASLTTATFWGASNPATFFDMNHLSARINVGWAF